MFMMEAAAHQMFHPRSFLKPIERVNSLLPPGATLDWLDGLEVGLYLLAVRLEERGKRELLAEMFRVLIGGEAGTVGCDLEEYPARLPEVDRTEVVAVYDRRHIKPCLR